MKHIIGAARIALYDANYNYIGSASPVIDRRYTLDVSSVSSGILFSLTSFQFESNTANILSNARYAKLYLCVYRSSEYAQDNGAYIAAPNASGSGSASWILVVVVQADVTYYVFRQVSTSTTVYYDTALTTLPDGSSVPQNCLTIYTDFIALNGSPTTQAGVNHAYQRFEIAATFADLTYQTLYDNKGVHRIERSANDTMIALTRYRHRNNNYQRKQALGKGQGFWYPLNNT